MQINYQTRHGQWHNGDVEVTLTLDIVYIVRRDPDRRSHPCSMRGETLISIELRAYFKCVQFNYSCDSAHCTVCNIKRSKIAIFVFFRNISRGGGG